MSYLTFYKSDYTKRRIMVIIGTIIILSLANQNVKGQNLQISGGNNFSVSLCSDGKVYAWGKNDNGQLGRDASNVKYPEASFSGPRLVYLPSSNSLTMRQVDAGSGNTGIALACDGSVWTWGGNCGNGNIGNGTSGGSCSGSPTDGTNYYSSMQRVVGGEQGGAFLTNISYINASTRTSFAVESGTGRVLAWGNNGDGDLGLGTTGSGTPWTPTYVLTAAGTQLTGITIVEGTDYGAYALASDGYVYSWGGNSNQDLGRAIAGSQYYARRVRAWDYTLNDGSLVDLSNIVKMSGGDTHGLAIDASGNLWSWGGDWGPGQRGWGATSTAQPYATRVVAVGTPCALNQWRIGPWLTGVTEVSAGQQHSIALLNDGRVVTFGNNTSGQLGVGNTTSFGCPQYVLTAAATQLTNIVGISDGDLWSFALTSSGQVYVWGENADGQLGLAGADRTFATLNAAIPTACSGSLLPCPIAALGSDILKCPGTSVTLLAGDNGDTYEYTWYYGSTATGPWTQIGALNQPYAAGAGAMLSVTIPRFYRVVIRDTRLYVADRCGACTPSEDVIQVVDRTPPLATSAAGTCGTNVCFDINSTGAVDNDAFDWYATQVSPTKLNTAGTVNPFCTAKSNLTLNGGNWEIWADDRRVFQSTVGPTTAPCAPTGGSAGSKYQQLFIVYSDIVINEVDVFYRTYSVPGGPITYDAANVKVYSNDPNKNSTSTDGVNALTGLVSSTFALFPRTSTTYGAATTMTGLNLALTGSPAGTKYWLEISGLSNGEFGELTCAASYPYTDAVPAQTIVNLDGSTTSAQAIQRADYNALGYNWKFTYTDGYPCGRFRLTAPDATVTCLPVNFLSFYGENKGKTNHLYWSTSFEQNSDYFEVQKSYDGISWFVIGKVDAAGNSDGINEYSFTDFVTKSGNAYYRIVEKDIDMAESTSSMLMLSATAGGTINVSPNPNNGQFTIETNGALGDNTSIQVIDIIGRVVFQSTENFSFKSVSKELNLTNVDKGIYFLTLSDGSYYNTNKIIIE